MLTTLLPYRLNISNRIDDDQYEGVILLMENIENLKGDTLEALQPPIKHYVGLDPGVGKQGTVSLIVLLVSVLKKLQYFCPIGPTNRDFDDERCFSEAAQKAIKRTLSARLKRVLIVCAWNSDNRYPTARLAALLGAMQELYTPLEVRETSGHFQDGDRILGIWSGDKEQTICPVTLPIAVAIENGRTVARDIGGSDPERMSSVAVAGYVQEIFKDSVEIDVQVVSDQEVIKKDYPLVHAVNRGANEVARHQARVVKLFYKGAGPIEETLMLVGKGVTMDTGGLNIKVGDAMNGMSRDKCGAGAVIGFFKTLEMLKPKELKVIAIIPLVRNGVGPESYSCDEILTGRLIMLDPLCELRQAALKEVNPHLYTIATLTAHAWLSVGDGYNIVVCNGPAQRAGEAERLRHAGKCVADMFEISTLRREDYEANMGQTVYENLIQCNATSSMRTPRGHTIPAAFMILGSGLEKHGCDASVPIKYTHIDTAAGSGPPFPQVPWGSPVAALTVRHILQAYLQNHTM